MIHRLDDRLREEARRYRLVFACPDCASFDPGEPGGDAQAGDPGQAGSDAQAGDPGHAGSDAQAGDPGHAGSDAQAGDPGRPGSDVQSNDRGGPALARHAPRCSLGYPAAPHLDRALDHRDEIVFCKAFELR